MLAGGTPDEVVPPWETGTGKQITKGIRSAGSPPSVTAVSWSPDGEMMLVGRGNHTMQLWELNSPKIVLRPASHDPGTILQLGGGADR